MGWRDAPEVDPAAAPPKWASAPEVEAPKPSTADVPPAQMASHHPIYETAIAHTAQGLGLGSAPTLRGLYAAGAGTPDNPGASPDNPGVFPLTGGMDPLSTAANVLSGAWKTLTGDKKAIQRKAEAAAAERKYLDDLAAANPKTAFVSQVVGGIPAASLVAPAAAAPTLFGRMGQAAIAGGKLGAASGAARSEKLADVPGNVLSDALVGTLAWPVAQVGTELVPAAARSLGSAARKYLPLIGRLQPTEAAKLLEREGVNLTVGQKAPQSALGIIERASADQPFGIGPQRATAVDSWRQAVLKKALRDPKTQIPKDTDAAFGAVYERFKPEYDAIRDIPIDPKLVADLPKASAMPKRGVDARTREGVKAEVENALTVLGGEAPKAGHAHGHGAPAASKEQGLLDAFGREIPPTPPPPEAPPTATAGDLMKVRGNIRDNIRAARRAQDFDRLRLLHHAEEVVTDALDKSLPPEAQSALRDIDRRYSLYSTIEAAAPGGHTNFTPAQLLRSTERSSGRRAFKQGEAGILQDLGEAGRDALTDAPMTGYRPGVLASLPWAKYWGAPVARAANSPAGKRFLFSPPPAAPAPALTPVEFVPHGDFSGGFEELLRALRGPRFSRGAAEEEDRK